jgi:GTPase SAR1 family protein
MLSSCFFLSPSPTTVSNTTFTLHEKAQVASPPHHEKKILLLGTGYGGKTTLFNQICFKFSGFPPHSFSQKTPEEIQQTREAIQENVVDSFTVIVNTARHNLSVHNQTLFREIFDRDYLFFDAQRLLTVKDIATHMLTLWQDPACQNTYIIFQKRHNLDFLQYFLDLDNIFRITALHYVPTHQDILRTYCTQRADAVVLQTAQIVANNLPFTLVDLGGGRHARQTWKHQLKKRDVSIIIFVVALDEFDRFLIEDRNLCRSHESVAVFEDVVKRICSFKTSTTRMILVLNKFDAFATKLFNVPYRVPGNRNDDFIGPYFDTPNVASCQVIQAALDHTLQKFIARVPKRGCTVSHLVTNALASESIEDLMHWCVYDSIPLSSVNVVKSAKIIA